MKNNFESVVYLRKLNAQELGYRRGRPRGAGRYFLVSKGAAIFFPPLSEVIVNDNVFLDVIPPFSEDVVLSKYVYHNDRIAGEGTRDEYRLYLNTGNDRDRDYFKPGDIVLIVKIYLEDSHFVYKFLRYQKGEIDYDKVAELLDKHALNPQKTHALAPFKEVLEIDKIRKIDVGEAGNRVIPSEVIENAFEQPVDRVQVAEEDKHDVTRVLRSRSFRDLTMYFYEGKCAITGEEILISHRFLSNLEAAHILARAAGGGSHPSNAMALERNLHWAFDKGFFTLTSDYKVEVHPDAMHISYLASKHGQQIFLPQDDRSRPDKNSIQWHRVNVFGLFLKTDS